MKVKCSFNTDNNITMDFTPQTEGSAGLDLVADIPYQISLEPDQMEIISTGFTVEIPHGHVGLLFLRSSMGFKYGISMTNSVGVIDSDYRGIVKVRLINHSNKAHVINPGDRIAQLVIVPIPSVEYENITLEELSNTDRGTNGFGSTGRQ